MAITLYDATASHFLSRLGAVRVCLAKGLEHATAVGLDPDELVDARLIEDMFPLYQQIRLVAHHSANALRDVQAGAFALPSRDRLDYAGLQALVAEAEAAVAGWAREAVDALAGGEVVLKIGESGTSFTAEAFLTAFSLPNFYFHAATAYDILRARGVPIGKRDWLGQMRTTL